MKVLPDSYLRCLSAKDRKSMGKAGQTAAETLAKADVKTEKDLQRQIIALLRLKGIEVNVSRMDKKKTDSVGWPDLTFSITGDLRGWEWGSESCAWEVKLPGRQLDKAQQEMMVKLTTKPNGWQYSVIHSVDQAIKELSDMGID